MVPVSRRILLIPFLLSGFLAGPIAASAQGIDTSAPNVILIEAETGGVLFEKNPDAPVIPASTAKIMTAELVFQNLREGRIHLDDTFLISETAWRQGGAPSRGSSMYAALNSHVRVEDLIRGLVIDSGNDAAIALAEGLAGSEGAFATLMTKRARELGLDHSVFTNAWGRGDPDQLVTARDMARLAAHVITTYPDYYKYFGEKEFTWNKIRQTNRNPLLTMDFGADGLKTGNIDASGYGLVGSAVQNGERLILALYGAKNAKERADEARRLFLWGFRSFTTKTVYKANETIGTARVFGGAKTDVDLVAHRDIKLLIPHLGGEKFTGKIVYTGPLPAPVEEGQQVGQLIIRRGTLDALEIPLYTAEAVPQGPLPRRALDAGYEAGVLLWRKYMTKP